jgi:hypothetical protein
MGVCKPMVKKEENKKSVKPKLSKAALYALFVKPGDIAFRKGEKVRGFSI